VEIALSPGNANPVDGWAGLNFAATENIVLLATRAFGTAQAADKQNRHPRRHYQCQEATARHEPMQNRVHKNKLPETIFVFFDADFRRFAVSDAQAVGNLKCP